MSEPLGITVETDHDFAETVDIVTAALKEQGFGVLTRIDVDKTLKEKIGAEFRPYAILGACNPVLAHKALNAEPDVGLLLPCNVTVETTGEGKSRVQLIDPHKMMGFGALGENATLREVADEAYKCLSAAAEKIRGA